MSYCLHPSCSNPQNPNDQKACCTCGTKLLLKARYRATHLSSDGEFVRTFRGLDAQTDQPVTIKQIRIPPEILRVRAKKQKILHAFEETAQTLCQLDEIANLHTPTDFSATGNGLYLIKSVVLGKTVEQLLETQGALKERAIRQLLKDILPALQALHDKDLLHRDICPQNIVYDHQQGQFLLTDVGIPQLVAESLRDNVFSVGEYRVGDPIYSAPEQIDGETAPTSDIYSLGIVCLQAITRLAPIDLIDIQGNVRDYQEYLSNNPISQQLQEIMEKMSAKSTLERYVQVQAILTDLNDSTSSLMKQITSTATRTSLNLMQSGTGLVTKTFSKLPRRSKS